MIARYKSFIPMSVEFLNSSNWQLQILMNFNFKEGSHLKYNKNYKVSRNTSKTSTLLK